MKQFGKISMQNVFSSLPEVCRDKLTNMKKMGWNCSFFLGVIEDSICYGVSAQKGQLQHISCNDDVNEAIDRLFECVTSTL